MREKGREMKTETEDSDGGKKRSREDVEIINVPVTREVKVRGTKVM